MAVVLVVVVVVQQMKRASVGTKRRIFSFALCVGICPTLRATLPVNERQQQESLSNFLVIQFTMRVSAWKESLLFSRNLPLLK